MKKKNTLLCLAISLACVACDPIESIILPERIYGPLTCFMKVQFVLMDNPLNPQDTLLGIVSSNKESGVLRDDTLGNVISCMDKNGTLLDSIILYSQNSIWFDSLGNAMKRIYVIHTDTIARQNTSLDTLHFSLSDWVSFGGKKDRPYGDPKKSIRTYVFKTFDPFNAFDRDDDWNYVEE